MFDLNASVLVKALLLLTFFVLGLLLIKIRNRKIVPISVNYFLHRQCNYQCKFCFHTAKNSLVLPLEEAKRGLKLLKDAGMKKLNFSGGEPFLKSKILGQLV